MMAFITELGILLRFSSRAFHESEYGLHPTPHDFYIATKENQNASSNLVLNFSKWMLVWWVNLTSYDLIDEAVQTLGAKSNSVDMWNAGQVIPHFRFKLLGCGLQQ